MTRVVERIADATGLPAPLPLILRDYPRSGLLPAGRGSIPVSALSYAAQGVGLPAGGGLHIGSGGWKAVTGPGYSYVIEITRPQSGTSLSSYEMGAKLE